MNDEEYGRKWSWQILKLLVTEAKEDPKERMFTGIEGKVIGVPSQKLRLLFCFIGSAFARK
jgi:hypothetical protein